MNERQPHGDPRNPEQLDRPYGDQETDYVVFEPEGPAPEPETAGELGEDPVEQAGGGQAEGFEDSEALLIDHAENAPPPELTADGFDLSDPGTDVDPDWRDTVEKDLSDTERVDEGVLAQPRDEEARRATGVAGEPDEIDTTEVTSDPDEGPDDPGAGPGLAHER